MLPPLNISNEIADDILCRLTAAIAFVTGALQAKVAAA
jgi:hypothetical protein